MSEETKRTWRLLIVDDQAIVRQGLKVMLEQDASIRVTHEAANGKEAIRLLEGSNLIDLVLMDIRMPEMNGMEATRIIKTNWPQIKILILTTFNDEQYALETLKDGANGFLLKTAEMDQLIRAVHSTMDGGMPINEAIAAKVIPKMLKSNSVKEITIDLTTREISIINLVGTGKTNKEIATTLFLSIGTVKNHLTVILQKLTLRDRTQLAIYAVTHNLV